MVGELDCQRVASQDLDLSIHADNVDIVIDPVIGLHEQHHREVLFKT